VSQREVDSPFDVCTPEHDCGAARKHCHHGRSKTDRLALSCSALQVLGLALECLPHSALVQRQEVWLSLVSQVLRSAAAASLQEETQACDRRTWRGEVPPTAPGARPGVHLPGAAPSAVRSGKVLEDDRDSALGLQLASRGVEAGLESGGASYGDAVESWEPVYYGLLLLEKILAQQGPEHREGYLQGQVRKAGISLSVLAACRQQGAC